MQISLKQLQDLLTQAYEEGYGNAYQEGHNDGAREAYGKAHGQQLGNIQGGFDISRLQSHGGIQGGTGPVADVSNLNNAR